jgi:hypothetical protein
MPIGHLLAASPELLQVFVASAHARRLGDFGC